MTYESTLDVLTVDSRTAWLKRVFNFADIEFTFTKAYLQVKLKISQAIWVYISNVLDIFLVMDHFLYGISNSVLGFIKNFMFIVYF